MATGTLISVEEYLNTSYDPDVEYVDGELVERNVGDWLHSLVQSNIIYAFRRKYPSVFTIGELRTRTRGTRYRLPDVCLLLAPPKTRFLLAAPLVAIEIVSRDDRWDYTMDRLNELLEISTPNIWMIDPRHKTIYTYDGSIKLVTGDAITTTDGSFEFTRDEIFENC
jgi:Uma2 family endonuclease